MENEAETTELNMSTAFFLSCWIDDDDNDAKAQRKFTNFFSSLVCVAGHSFSFCSFFSAGAIVCYAQNAGAAFFYMNAINCGILQANKRISSRTTETMTTMNNNTMCNFFSFPPDSLSNRFELFFFVCVCRDSIHLILILLNT